MSQSDVCLTEATLKAGLNVTAVWATSAVYVDFCNSYTIPLHDVSAKWWLAVGQQTAG